ncbi:L-serine ammonia-lyase [Granulosicoccus antarcticus]|uniref:L-serine dehydratase n=1 Tax=Granulosicoccus antarcticus IMCC3135 TaxID=1192854 RepID=A0A2Z2NRA2_9GAMM|nr:L-serine ammonia-lyase [Granulosicoccus antarcticus]ASJ71270.1 L-serine dehydratase 1 [Granulosicoccus antarcticus IMCC3135]
MAISVFDLFKSGIGPSSSHTVGPMIAARRFVMALAEDDLTSQVARCKVELYGSLGATGKGHGSDTAVLLGLEGEHPTSIVVETIAGRLEGIRQARQLTLPGAHVIVFDEKRDLVMHKRRALPFHPNAMQFIATDSAGSVLSQRIYYSVGGGFVLDDTAAEGEPVVKADETPVRYPFTTGDRLLELCAEHDMSICEIMMQNELSWRTEAEVREELLALWEVMQDCVKRGCQVHGILPGGLKVKRRAAELYEKLSLHPEAAMRDPLTVMDWVNLYALAVNEENAAGGRVVTAPTNGAAGIIPAVLHYYHRFVSGASEKGIVDFLLTAGAIGILYKENASISGAEVGCQGEVGSACSMAAGALAAVQGGTPEQVENAAEIGMEHNLGLTCDPVGGLVQVPCIERNAMGSIKAINAARIALRGDGKHFVSLDKVIKTMRETGADMKTKYKETARGGLAINVIEVPVSFPDC